MKKEMPASYYSEIYEKGGEYKKNYTDSIYYTIWLNIVSKLSLNSEIFEIIC